jgi:hypothetical protein
MYTQTLIHLIWLQGEDDIPLKYLDNLDAWRKFGRVRVWDNKMIRRLLKDHFPKLLPVYDGYPIFVQKADLGRYLILYFHGGLYGDMDTYPPEENFAEIVKRLAAVGSNQVAMPKADVLYMGVPPFNSRIRNWFIYVPKSHHPFFLECLRDVPNHAERRWYQIRSYYVAASTGSVFLTHHLDESFYPIDIDKLVHNSYASSWGGLFYLDNQDKALIVGLIVIIIIVILILSAAIMIWRGRSEVLDRCQDMLDTPACQTSLSEINSDFSIKT